MAGLEPPMAVHWEAVLWHFDPAKKDSHRPWNHRQQ